MRNMTLTRLRRASSATRAVVAAAGVAVIAALYVFVGADAFSSGVTTYDGTCLVAVVDNQCASPGRTYEPSSFVVSVERQEVMYSYGGGEGHPLKDCRVRTRRDWTCRSADGGHELGFSAGVPWVRLPPSSGQAIYSMPRWRWLWLRLGERSRSFSARGIRPAIR